MKKIYINLPVADLEKSTNFYEALGFIKNPVFSDNNASSMMWGENIFVMLLKHDFYKNFIGSKNIIDAKNTSGVLIALEMDSKEKVQKFADTAKEHGGEYFMADFNKNFDFMFTYEVSDPDGHTWEPVYMDMSKFPQE